MTSITSVTIFTDMSEDVFTDFATEGEALASSSVTERAQKKTLEEKEITLGSDPTSAIVSIQRKKNFSLLNCIPRIAAIFTKAPRSVEVSTIRSEPLSVAEELIERARGNDLTRVSPLGALQLGIERINLEARDAVGFKAHISRKLFSRNGATREQVDKLWENSSERKALFEIYAMIDLSKDVGRPITFRDAFNRVYESKQPHERTALDRIAKALIGGR